jgi:hypothetical protein
LQKSFYSQSFCNFINEIFILISKCYIFFKIVREKCEFKLGVVSHMVITFNKFIDDIALIFCYLHCIGYKASLLILNDVYIGSD